MNILLTGGAGFIGSHVGDLLIEHDHQVTIVDDLSAGRRSNLPPGCDFYEMDIRSKEINSLWQEKQFDTLVHLAAQMDVRKSVEDPLFDSDVNIRGSLNLMEAGKDNGLKRVVFTSTGGAGYDDNVTFPTPESTPAKPISPYGIAKISFELYLRYYERQYGIQNIALRLANVYGPRQNPFGEAGVVAIFAQRLLADNDIIINGDGLQTRDYVFCQDIAKAIHLALAYEDNGFFNIGTSIETSVVEIFQLIRQATGSDAGELHGPEQSGEVRRSALDVALAEKELGWKPVVTLQEGIRETIEYFRQLQIDPDKR
ncbi:MAG: NAD-dependent epimerase/dehydratase family protein [Candidatus Electryonea clarkiae]|nr:NAD-dependent epimerase/dehydratase family protein [Candidatus Electryonea clarkiae]MDP8287089.1 NAD-dependent epimerase/dehydratase family protein [Candidatus Electryonea clarkiae]